MKTEIADKAGFCFGVARAVKIAQRAAEGKDKTVTYGMLIHNRDVTEELKNLGVGTVESVDEIKSGVNVIIRAHGISADEEAEINNRGAKIIDATCPFVKKIHTIAAAAAVNGAEVIIVGDPNHPEVKGIDGRCLGRGHIINSIEEAEQIKLDILSDNVVIVAQTTLRKDFFKKIEKILKKHFTNAKIFDTICSATDERQKAAAELASRADCMIVIGAAESSNTKKLYELCSEHCENTVAVENDKELKKYIKQGKFPAFKK